MKPLIVLTGCCLVAFAAGAAQADQGSADLAATQPGSPVAGHATLVETSRGLDVTVIVAKAPPGAHGLHIHDKGDCADAGNAAGGHFNPDGVPHGFAPKAGTAGAHAGDMGNIQVDQDGRGMLSVILPGVTLREGSRAVIGRAIILHEQPDDFGQPTGNAGGRIACGVIAAD